MAVTPELYAEASEFSRQMVISASRLSAQALVCGELSEDIITAIVSAHAAALALLLHSIELFVPSYQREQFVQALRHGIFEGADNETKRMSAQNN